ncbi:MAG TPA: hypothetical protein PK293_12125, partial [Spirochaetota bacterium]|nr:hypothetical protein [Spirochaetota bacterium]
IEIDINSVDVDVNYIELDVICIEADINSVNVGTILINADMFSVKDEETKKGSALNTPRFQNFFCPFNIPGIHRREH